MSQSNEFEGADLRDAVKKATAAYDRKNNREINLFCIGLKHDYDVKSRELDRLLDRMVDLQRNVDGLKQQASREAAEALVASLVVVGRALKIAGNVISRTKFLPLNRRTKRNLGSLVREARSVFSSAIASAVGLDSIEKAREIEREITQLKADYDRIANEMLDLTDSIERGNCHLGS